MIFKRAFTLLELVFVIIVIAIITAIAIPDSRDSKLDEGAVQLISHIKYTQHLAMVDDKYDATNNTWFRNRWQITFNGDQYTIESDMGGTIARNPLDQTPMQQIDLNDVYGATVTFGANCPSAGNVGIISFDHLGRPLTGNIAVDVTPYPVGRLITNTCNISLTSGANDVNITIAPETGYAQISR